MLKISLRTLILRNKVCFFLPKNLHLNKEQEMDDSTDQHPLPPEVGIKKVRQ